VPTEVGAEDGDWQMAEEATPALGLSIGATNLAAVTADHAITRKPVLTLYRQRPPEVGVPSENPRLDEPGLVINDFVDRVGDPIGIVAADREAASLGNVLVVELGTNGSVTPTDFDAMMQAAAGVQRVVFVNVDVPRPWAAPDNAVLAAGVARYPGVAVLADWDSLSSGHPEWFTPDQVHLEPAGAQALAGLIAQDA